MLFLATLDVSVFSLHDLKYPPPCKASAVYSRIFLCHYLLRQIVWHRFCNVVYGNEARSYFFISLLTFCCFPPFIAFTKGSWELLLSSSWLYNESLKKQTLILFVVFVWKVKWQHSLMKHDNRTYRQIVQYSENINVVTRPGLGMDLHSKLS